MRRLAGLLLLAAACSRAPALPRLQQSGYESLQQGLLQAAEASAQEGLRRSRAQRDALWERRFLVLFAEVLVESGREAEALSLLAPLAVPQAAAVEDARALMTRGRARCLASNAADDVRAAAADLARARQIAGELELSGLTAEISRHEGTCALLRNDYAAAEELYLESHALAHAERQVFLESKAANNLGLLRIWGRRYDEAADWLTRALELASTLEGHLDVVSILTNLGWSHYMLGDYERALAVLSRAAALMVSGDTGPLHIAGAAGTPLVAIFGPTDPERNGPWAAGDQVVSRYGSCECHYQRQCRQAAWCLGDVSVAEVTAAIQQRLGPLHSSC